MKLGNLKVGDRFKYRLAEGVVYGSYASHSDVVITKGKLGFEFGIDDQKGSIANHSEVTKLDSDGNPIDEWEEISLVAAIHALLNDQVLKVATRDKEKIVTKATYLHELQDFSYITDLEDLALVLTWFRKKKQGDTEA